LRWARWAIGKIGKGEISAGERPKKSAKTGSNSQKSGKKSTENAFFAGWLPAGPCVNGRTRFGESTQGRLGQETDAEPGEAVHTKKTQRTHNSLDKFAVMK
jgi:hypothetical protein